MEIYLKERTEETVRIYFEKVNTAKIKAVLPQKTKTVEEALEDYQQTLLPSCKLWQNNLVRSELYW